MGVTTFKGGVHPYDGKDLAKDQAIVELKPQGLMVYPLSQHIGAPAKPVVAKGDRVLVGQKIAEAGGFISAPVICSVSGTVKSIEKKLTAGGAMVDAIVVENDQQYEAIEGFGQARDYTKLTRDEIVNIVKEAGIVGLGGAGFPTSVKLAPKNVDKIDYVLVNGAECEPYITCDDQLMRTKSAEIVAGIELILRLFPNAKGVVVIEENKPQAIAAMEEAVKGHDRVYVQPVKTKYPQGGERSLITVITQKHLKLGMLPADAGCVVDNVGTIYAIYRAVCFNEPLMERGFTVSGDAVEKPGNFWIKIGTSHQELVDACGGFKQNPEKVLSGGPMMGFAMTGLEAPICKNNNALTALLVDEVQVAEEEMTACLRCGRCSRACPLGLSPQLMQVAAIRKDYERYEHKLYGLDCIGCGCCTYGCPAKRPLMQLFKTTKAEIMAMKKR